MLSKEIFKFEAFAKLQRFECGRLKSRFSMKQLFATWSTKNLFNRLTSKLVLPSIDIVLLSVYLSKFCRSGGVKDSNPPICYYVLV